MTAYSWERDEWNRAHDSASDGDWHDPADRDVDPVEVTPEQVAAWREGYEAWLRDREAS